MLFTVEIYLGRRGGGGAITSISSTKTALDPLNSADAAAEGFAEPLAKKSKTNDAAATQFSS
jgi:hypothetical protein